MERKQGHYLGGIDLACTKPEKYYLGLCVRGMSPKQAHVTVCYFGEISKDTFKKIEEICNHVYSNSCTELIESVYFDTRNYFGPEKNIPVLRPSTYNENRLRDIEFLVLLRHQLLHWDKSRISYPKKWCPHITTGFETVKANFDRFSIIDNFGNEIRIWHLGDHYEE